MTVTRARKIQRFLSQPMFVAEVFTTIPGIYVPIEETVRSFEALVGGDLDDVPEQAFLNVGGVDDVLKKAKDRAGLTADGDLTHAELVTPERVLFSGEAEFVVLRTDGGEIMFLPTTPTSSAPSTSASCASKGYQAPAGLEQPARREVAPGREGSGGEPAPLAEVRAAVHGGFVMVADNKVTIVAGVAELADEIDVARADALSRRLKLPEATPKQARREPLRRPKPARLRSRSASKPTRLPSSTPRWPGPGPASRLPPSSSPT